MGARPGGLAHGDCGACHPAGFRLRDLALSGSRRRHGPVGRGVPAAGYPQLRAQHAVYVVQQLTQYAAGMRYTRDAKGNSNGGPYSQIMHTIASRLTPQDMRDVASYVQGMR